MTEKPSVPEIRARLEAATAPIATSRGWIFGADAALVAHAPTDIAFLLERLDAVRKYVDDPGNWSALDGRRRVLLDLIEGGSDV